MNAFEPLLWTAAAYIVVRIIQTDDQRLWLWFGVVAGIGLENKYSMGLFGLGIAAGLLLTRERLALRQRWIWLGLAIAMLIWLPNLVWNFQHHWPFLELMRNVRHSGRDVAVAPPAFMRDQALFMNPATAPLWVSGAFWYFFGQRGRYRTLGWTAGVVLGVLIVLRSKGYYAWPVYAMLFAAGGVTLEQRTNGARLRWARPTYAAPAVILGSLLAPITLPVLSPPVFISYYNRLFREPPQVEHQRLGPMRQQIYADMFGWKEMAKEVARAYYSLPPDVRAKTAIGANSYGTAGAVDFYGRQYGLPPVLSGHQNYWFWGTHGFTGESMLLLDQTRHGAQRLCDDPQVVGRTYHPLSREDEHFEIFLCHPLRRSLDQIWPDVKHWN
jgi:hypothetical protein